MVDTITGVEEYKTRINRPKKQRTEEQKRKRAIYMKKYRKEHPYISKKK